MLPWGLADVRGWACQGEVLNRHFFGTFAPDPLGPATYEEFTAGQVLVGKGCNPAQYCKVPCDQPCLHLLALDAVEILRVTGDGLGPLSSSILSSGSGLPAGAVRMQNVSQIKAIVSINRGTIPSRFFMDFNQSIELHTSSICVDILAPANFVEVPMEAPFGDVERTGLVADELIGQNVIRIESPTGLREVKFSESVFVLANTRAVIRVPPYAKALTVYQSGIGTAETSWEMHYGDPGVGSVEAGTIPWIAGARKTEPHILMPSVTHLRTGIDVGNDRFFTLHWTIRP